MELLNTRFYLDSLPIKFETNGQVLYTLDNVHIVKFSPGSLVNRFYIFLQTYNHSREYFLTRLVGVFKEHNIREIDRKYKPTIYAKSYVWNIGISIDMFKIGDLMNELPEQINVEYTRFDLRSYRPI